MESEDTLKDVLTLLKGDAFLEIFKDHNIDTSALKYMTPSHLDVIVPKPLFGVRIIFEHHLKTWQNEMSSSFNDSKQSSISSLLEHGEFSIEAVLKSSISGKSILTYYDINKKIITKFRRMIASCVIAYIIENKINPSPKYFEKIAENIVKHFTTENKDLYFIHKKGRKPGGCLYSKYHNAISNLKKEGLSLHILENNSENFENIELDSADEDNMLNDKQWLMNNIEPMSDVFEKWANTFRIRRNFIEASENGLEQIFKEWPIYKQSFGNNLILADFSKIYPEKEHLLEIKWEAFCTQMLKNIERDVKDKENLELLSKYKESEYNSDVRDCVILELIHSVLKPASRKCIIIDKKRRKYQKASVEDSKKSFLLCASNNSELNTQIKLLVDEYFHKKKTLYNHLFAQLDPQFLIFTSFMYILGAFFTSWIILNRVWICHLKSSILLILNIQKTAN